MRDRRGLSLVELIVAVAVLGMISMILTSFLRSGSLMYRRISSHLSLQVQSQLALSQLQEYIIDANAGIYFDATDDKLYIFTIEGGDPYCHMFAIDRDKKLLYYDKCSVSRGREPAMGANPPEMAGNVIDFLVTAAPAASFDETIEAWNLDSVTIKLSFTLHNSSYDGELTIALRNRPLCADDLDTLIDEVLARASVL